MRRSYVRDPELKMPHPTVVNHSVQARRARAPTSTSPSIGGRRPAWVDQWQSEELVHPMSAECAE
ncbi:hypothetical protein C8Q73DRAFT_708682 [Cubamyces lactineus]|nr:hypothetical protein C8Q73DRAFT_708682 [Cubamyces lactineus]